MTREHDVDRGSRVVPLAVYQHRPRFRESDIRISKFVLPESDSVSQAMARYFAGDRWALTEAVAMFEGRRPITWERAQPGESL